MLIPLLLKLLGFSLATQNKLCFLKTVLEVQSHIMQTGIISYLEFKIIELGIMIVASQCWSSLYHSFSV